MKCKSCGVNYDDGDKECPICGMGVGKGQRGAMQYTTYDTGSDLPTRRPVGRIGTASAPDAPPREKPKAKFANKLIMVFLGILLILCTDPELLTGIKNGLNSIFASSQQHTPEIAEQYGEDIWISPGESFGSRLSTTLPDGGVFMLTFDDAAETYELMQSKNGDAVYAESGMVSCLYNWPDDGFYEDGFEPPDYDSYMLYLEATEWTGGEQAPTDSDYSNQYTMLIIYRDTQSNDIVLSNAFGETHPYFAQQQMLDLYRAQSA